MTTVTLGANTGNTGGCEDNAPNSFATTTVNNGTGIEVDNIGSGFPGVGLIRFTGLPAATVTVSSATLYLWLLTDNPNFWDTTMKVRRILPARDWVETQATWNIWKTSNNWTTAGCLSDGNDRVATPSSSMASYAIGGTGAYYAITGLAADVEGFINGTFTNNGWLLSTDDGGSGQSHKTFASTSGTDGQRPYLEVVYTAGGGVVGHLIGGKLTGSGILGGRLAA
jgi:hypothetical protein